MKSVLIDLFTSKKFLAAVTAVVIYVAGRFGFDVDTAVLDRIFAAFLVYVGAQGVADHGKSAAAINAVAANSGSTSESVAAMKRVAGTVSVLALVVLGLGAGSQLSCTAAQVRQAAAAGVVAALDCEAAHLDATTLEDAKRLAGALVEHWIGGGPAASSDAIAADLAPIRSDLGRCAVAGALAAATIAVTPTSAPGTTVQPLVSGPPPLDPARLSFAAAARAAGWPAVRLPGGQVL